MNKPEQPLFSGPTPLESNCETFISIEKAKARTIFFSGLAQFKNAYKSFKSVET